MQPSEILPLSSWTPPELLPLPSSILSNILHKPYPIFRPVLRDDLGGPWLDVHAGPTQSSNWLVPGHLLITANPGALSDDDLELLLADDVKVSLFVNLLPEINRVPYEDRVLRILNGCRDVTFACSEIANLAAPPVEQAEEIVTKIVSEIRSGGIVAVHCRSGCGRAGTIGADVLGRLYPAMPLSEALGRVQAGHSSRPKRFQVIPSPETRLQRLSVAEFFGVDRVDLQNLMPGVGEVRREPELPPHMPIPGRTYFIRSKGSGHVIGFLPKDLPEDLGNLTVGVPLRQLSRSNSVESDTEVTFLALLNTDDGTWSFRNDRTGLLVDIAGRETDLGVPVQLWPADGSSAQRFYVSPNHGIGGWRITAQCSMMCVDVPYCSTDDSVLLHQWVPNQTDAQIWYFDEVVQ